MIMMMMMLTLTLTLNCSMAHNVHAGVSASEPKAPLCSLGKDALMLMMMIMTRQDNLRHMS